jgi:FkbM family methyltransferase
MVRLNRLLSWSSVRWDRLVNTDSARSTYVISENVRAGSNLQDWLISAPWAYVQSLTESRLHEYLHCKRDEISLIVVVGGYLGHEFPTLLQNYPSASLIAFEPSERYGLALDGKYKANHRVHVVRKAVAERSGTRTFFETSLTGSGSLLKIGQLARRSYGMKEAEEFTVDAVTLDEFLGPEEVSLLWIDVQGAEGLVLEGAHETLRRTQAVFIEVSIFDDLYVNAVEMGEIVSFLDKVGFHLAQLGTDVNGTGNALFVRASR